MLLAWKCRFGSTKVVEDLCTLLRFSSSLLRNSINKNVYNSVSELANLLGAADDTVASLALDVLCTLAIPPALHKQQAPEMHHHSTALHSKSSSGPAHGRLLALARGWGTRGSGLGLLHCVTADDSEYGQGSLPPEAGEVNFDFFSNETESLVSVKLTAHDILAARAWRRRNRANKRDGKCVRANARRGPRQNSSSRVVSTNKRVFHETDSFCYWPTFIWPRPLTRTQHECRLSRISLMLWLPFFMPIRHKKSCRDTFKLDRHYVWN